MEISLIDYCLAFPVFPIMGLIGIIIILDFIFNDY